MKTAVRTIRWLLNAMFVLLVTTVLAVFLFASVGPGLGHQPFTIWGGSMTPAIPLGSVVDVTRVKPSELRVGDIVSIKAPNGVVETHRISRIVSLPDGLYIETKGDANKTPDPVLVPVSAVVGRVDFQLPLLGYLRYMLTIPIGVASILCLAFTLLLAIWLLEDIEREDEEEPEARTEIAPSTGELIGA